MNESKYEYERLTTKGSECYCKKLFFTGKILKFDHERSS